MEGGGFSENLNEAARRFRRKFFVWAGIILVLAMMIEELWIEIVIMQNPVVSPIDTVDIKFFEDWLDINIPFGSIPKKMQCYLKIHDQSINASVSIPETKLGEFIQELKDRYNLEPTYNNPQDNINYFYDKKESLYSFIYIYQAKNGYNEVYIQDENISEGMMGLFRKYIRAGKYRLGDEGI